jgi:hypothetical protein
VDLTYSMVNAFKKIMDKGWVSVRSVSIGPFSPTKMHHSMSTVWFLQLHSMMLPGHWVSALTSSTVYYNESL